MVEQKESCVKPTQGPIMSTESEKLTSSEKAAMKEDIKMLAKVGKPAPDFELSGFIDGGFKNIKLSDYKSKWIVLCFYPGDFTFV